MTVDQKIELVTYGLLAGAVVIAAVWDIRTRRIPNQISLFLCVLFLGSAINRVLLGADLLTSFLYPLSGALGVFLVTLFLFWRGYLGGGDAKLLSSLALFTPLPLLLPMLWIMAVAGGVLALVTLLWARATERTVSVPYGVAIMAAGFFVCLHKVPALQPFGTWA